MIALENRAGSFVRQQGGPEGYKAFVPKPLPPALVMDDGLVRLHEAAALALGQLAGASAHLDPDRLLYMYVRKEAVLSSRIEGTRSTLSELLAFENVAAPGTPSDDVREVSRYVAALLHGYDSIRTGRLPLSLRLIREMHSRLVEGGRGERQDPGEFRRTQNWIGGTRPGNAVFVPPPPHEVMPALDQWERFVHDEGMSTPTLIKAALAHAQFETIHPFLDGNGRVGRLLISLILLADGALPTPFFYISLYFMRNRADYYDALQRVRTAGDWEGWLRFFLVGVESVADEAARTAREMDGLLTRDRRRVAELGRAAGSALRVFEVLSRRVLVTATGTAEQTGATWPTVNAALLRLEQLGIANEVSGRRRDRVWVYSDLLKLLDEGVAG